MRYTIGILTICILAGCAGAPPKPPAVQGEYRPINKAGTTEPTSHAPTFDFIHEADVVQARTTAVRCRTACQQPGLVPIAAMN